ncbi:MAG: CotH kinase family protein [Verrucomicrobiales bacterium]|nr:CotH kinase family protein [Verrucomicrobiales bacterium]
MNSLRIFAGASVLALTFTGGTLAAPTYGPGGGGGSATDLFDVSQGAQVIVSTPQYPAAGMSDARLIFGQPGNGAWVEGTNAIFQDGTAGFTDVVEWQTPGWVNLTGFELRMAQDGTGSAFRGCQSFKLFASQDGVNFSQISGGTLPLVGGVNQFSPILINDTTLTGTATNVRAFRLELVRLTGGGPRVIELDGFGTPGEMPVGATFLDRLALNATTNTHTGRGAAMRDDEGPGFATDILVSSRVLGADTPEDCLGNHNGAVEPESFIFGDGGGADNNDRTVGNGGEAVDFIQWHTAQPFTLVGFRIVLGGDGTTTNRDTELVRFLVEGEVVDLVDNNGFDGAVTRLFADGAVTGDDFRVEFTKTTASGGRIFDIDAILGTATPHTGGVVVNEVCSENKGSLRDEDGDTPDWAELFNNSDAAADLSGWRLSDDPARPAKWVFPAGTVLPGRRHLIVFLSDKDRRVPGSPLHANFQIKAGGEPLSLSAADGAPVDATPAVRLGEDRTYGRFPNGSGAGKFFTTATPGQTNAFETPWDSLVHEKPEVSPPGGWHVAAQQVAITTTESDVTVRYTLDGSDPLESSPAVSGPVTVSSRVGQPNVLSMIEGTAIANQHTDGWKPPLGEVRKATVLRARSFRAGAPPGPILTHTYFIGTSEARNDGLPTLSIATTPAGLFDYHEGIYMLGKVFDDWRAANPGATLTGHSPANYTQRGSRWERSAHLEWFEPGMGTAEPGAGARAWGEPVAVDIQGQSSRSFRQKSLGIKARGTAGNDNSIGYDVFPGLKKRGDGQSLEDFRHLRLRNYGNDWDFAMMRDSWAAWLAQPLGLSVMSSRPVQTYLDGEYWGMLEVRENQDPRYLQAHYGFDDDEAVILYAAGTLEEGPPGAETAWTDLLAWCAAHHGAVPADFDYLTARVDADDALFYFLSEIFFANADWPQNNIRIWRRNLAVPDPSLGKGRDGKWRWFLFDVDLGTAHPWSAGVAENTLAVALAPNGRPAVPQTYGTQVFRTLMQNPGFRQDFINAAAVLLSAHFSPARAAALVNAMEAEMLPGIEEHRRRWQPAFGTVSNWQTQVAAVRSFAQQRAAQMRSHVLSQFGLAGTTAITLNVADGVHRGTLRVGKVLLDAAGLDPAAPWPWTGTFFRGQMLPLEAVPAEGWLFAGWSGIPGSTPTATLDTNASATVTAHFIPQPVRNLQAQFVEPGQVRISLTGTPLAPYRLQTSADLATWNEAGTASTTADGTASVTIPQGGTRLFIRALNQY